MPLTSFSFFFLAVVSALAVKSHAINFRWPNLYPEAAAWDPSSQHFVVGSHRHRTLFSVSDAAAINVLVSDHSLPPNSTILGVSVDNLRRRLLAVVHSAPPLPTFNALAAYDLRSPHHPRIFLAQLDDPAATDDRPIANDVAVDSSGNAYVTNAGGNFIWKITPDGEPSVFSRDPVFTSHPIERDTLYSFCGLNGVVYIDEGYLLVVQTNTGKMFRVNADDGTARTVALNKDLKAADGIAVGTDGVAVVVSQFKAHFIKGSNNWSEGVVFDEATLDTRRFPTSATIRDGERVYVLYGHVDEGMFGNGEREEFSLVEIKWTRERTQGTVWICVLVAMGLALLYFRSSLKRDLLPNTNKKTS